MERPVLAGGEIELEASGLAAVLERDIRVSIGPLHDLDDAPAVVGMIDHECPTGVGWRGDPVIGLGHGLLSDRQEPVLKPQADPVLVVARRLGNSCLDVGGEGHDPVFARSEIGQTRVAAVAQTVRVERHDAAGKAHGECVGDVER